LLLDEMLRICAPLLLLSLTGYAREMKGMQIQMYSQLYII
jgi:hypothetical protein